MAPSVFYLHNFTAARKHPIFPVRSDPRNVSIGKRKLRLLRSRQQLSTAKKQFRCGEKIVESGIYRVIHHKHRLPHEVTLLRDQLFPKCVNCDDSVYFELVRCAPDIALAPFKVALYALPVSDEEEEDFTVAL